MALTGTYPFPPAAGDCWWEGEIERQLSASAGVKWINTSKCHPSCPSSGVSKEESWSTRRLSSINRLLTSEPLRFMYNGHGVQEAYEQHILKAFS